MSKVTYSNNELIVNDSSVRFQDDILETSVFGDMVIVLLDWQQEMKSNPHRNVYGVDFGGNIKWQIERAPDKVADRHLMFVSLHERDGELWVNAAPGIAYKVDLQTGEITDSRVVK